MDLTFYLSALTGPMLLPLFLVYEVTLSHICKENLHKQHFLPFLLPHEKKNLYAPSVCGLQGAFPERRCGPMVWCPPFGSVLPLGLQTGDNQQAIATDIWSYGCGSAAKLCGIDCPGPDPPWKQPGKFLIMFYQRNPMPPVLSNTRRLALFLSLYLSCCLSGVTIQHYFSHCAWAYHMPQISISKQ